MPFTEVECVLDALHHLLACTSHASADDVVDVHAQHEDQHVDATDELVEAEDGTVKAHLLTTKALQGVAKVSPPQPWTIRESVYATKCQE